MVRGEARVELLLQERSPFLRELDVQFCRDPVRPGYLALLQALEAADEADEAADAGVPTTLTKSVNSCVSSAAIPRHSLRSMLRSSSRQLCFIFRIRWPIRLASDIARPKGQSLFLEYRQITCLSTIFDYASAPKSTREFWDVTG